MTRVKICGFREPAHLQAVLTEALPIDYVGFVFAPSKRQVTPEQVALFASLRMEAARRTQLVHESGATIAPPPAFVGVFVNPSDELLHDAITLGQLDVVQLHGQESPEHCQHIKQKWPQVAVWKVWSIAAVGDDRATATTSSRIPNTLATYAGHIDALLLDTHDPVYGGGSGQIFAWERIPPFADWCKDVGISLFVAGGLQPENVADLVSQYALDGVDVSSGVETEGRKDLDKIQRFTERVKPHGYKVAR